MAAEPKPQLQLEIAHVLFIDIVGYSKLLTDEQRRQIEELNAAVCSTDQFRSADTAGKLVRLTTGDGMALAFFASPAAPVRCAVEIAEKLGSTLPLRMGIHSGPVDQLSDLNDRPNIAGAGINIAQRVMDCGDAGHILLSKRAADDLAQYAEWSTNLHDLGEVEVKHGVRVAVTNLCFDGIGNPALPEKLKSAARAKRRRKTRCLIASLMLLFVAASVTWLLFGRSPSRHDEIASLPEKAIAVLPFENLSAEREDAFLAEGIHDDVVTSVGKIKELTVIARASMMAYRGDAVTGKLRDVGKALGVANILQGSIRRSADRIVINVQLIDVCNARQLWSERYDRTTKDLLSLQGELALEIARQLRATLSRTEATVIATKPTENPEAYLVYLRARETETAHRLGATREDSIAAAKLYQQAIDLDPKFALARARLSLCSADISHPDAEWQKELAEPQEALRLNPNLGEGHIALASCHWRRHNLEAVLAELDRAEELMPNSIEVWQIRASVYRLQDKVRERIVALQEKLLTAPMELNNWRVTAITLADLKWRWVWDPIRNDARFQKNLANPEPKTVY